MVDQKVNHMHINFTFDTIGVDWTEAVTIFERAPLGTRQPDVCERVFGNSDLVCFAWDGEKLVGMARALSDGERQSVIYDMCILPEYQGKHIGKTMLSQMLERLNTSTTILWAVPGKEGFYEQLGFKPMLTAMARFEDPESAAASGYIKLL